MSYNNGPCFIATWNKPFPSQAARKRAEKSIQAIDSSASLICTKIPGNDLRVWIERPNDGTNDHNNVRERNRQMVAAVNAELAK